MSSTTLPPVESLSDCSATKRAAVLDLLFEPCSQLHTLCLDLLRRQRFSSYNDLIASIGVMLNDLAESKSASEAEQLDKILSAHPRLGETKVDSAQSRAEQAQLQTDISGQQDRLQALNRVYERTFPGLRYMVFVNGRDRDTIMKNIEARIERNDAAMERADAIKAMCDIAVDRASKVPSSH